MAEITVSEFATNIGVSVERIQTQLTAAGLVEKASHDIITDSEKQILLAFLRKQHGKDLTAEPRKITLRRKTVTELKVPVATQNRGKTRSKTVNIEYRRRRTYAKRADVVERLKQEEEMLAAEKANDDKLANANLAADMPAPADPVKATVDTHEQQLPELVQGVAAQAETAQAETVAEPPAAAPSAPKQPATNRQELHIVTKTSRRRKPTRSGTLQQTIDNQHGFEKPTAPVVKEVLIPESITVVELAQRMSVKGSEVIKVMMDFGTMVSINQTIDQETAAVIVEEMGHRPKIQKEDALEEQLIKATKQQGNEVSRSPVVTIMGHVDHGKTSLLDYIRSAKVTSSEAGGITQHIGAYRVTTPGGEITFLDTPGHESFTAIRARGAKVTDLVVIVVAADDGVMPQTKEAIQHAQSAAVPIIVAINKIDKANADSEKVKQALAKLELIPEDWGGTTQFVALSALTGKGVDTLLENILLQAELLELKAVVGGPAKGTVIESRLDKGRGPVATVLVQNGTLNKGDIILSGYEFGRVRTLLDDNRNEVNAATPSMPVEVFGLSGLSHAGDKVIVMPDEKKARELAVFRKDKHRANKIAEQQGAKLESAMTQMQEDKVAIQNLLIKADVQGTTEALALALQKLSNEEVKINIIANGIGGITESDINLAMAGNAIVIGFNVRADSSARKLINAEGVDLRYYSIIYNVVDDIKAAMSGMLLPDVREQIIGVAEVREVFHSKKFGDIAGCMVTTGRIKRNNPIRVLRDNVVIYEGELESLRRFKEDVNEVKSGLDCGIGVKHYSDVQVGDQIEVFERVNVARKI